MANIVIVDDLLNSRVMLKEFMQIGKHRVIGDFEDALEALEFIINERPDIVLLDYNLNSFLNGKEYTGIDMLIDIKKKCFNTKVIFISAFAEIPIIKQAMSKGADDFIVKPFKGQDLLNRIQNALPKIG